MGGFRNGERTTNRQRLVYIEWATLLVRRVTVSHNKIHSLKITNGQEVAVGRWTNVQISDT
jgi:hypothetical protein